MMNPLVALAALAAAQNPAELRDFAVDDDGPLIHFIYSWPAEAETPSALGAAMRAAMARDRARTIEAARRQQALARRGHYPFTQHGFTAAWTIEGASARLVSLSAVTETYAGGGHSEHGYDTRLWDVAARRAVAMRAVLSPAAVAAMGPVFCPAWEAARADHYGEAAPDRDSACPPLAERAAAPADVDRNGRFETYRVFIATGYFDAEGYTVDLPLRAEDVARIPAAYRASFEAAPRP